MTLVVCRRACENVEMWTSRHLSTGIKGLEFRVMLCERPDAEPPQWLEKFDLHTVAVLTLDDGERLTDEILDFNDDRDELIVNVVCSNHVHPNRGQRDRAVPVSRVISCKPRPRAQQPWPYSDPCRGMSFSFARFA